MERNLKFQSKTVQGADWRNQVTSHNGRPCGIEKLSLKAMCSFTTAMFVIFPPLQCYIFFYVAVFYGTQNKVTSKTARYSLYTVHVTLVFSPGDALSNLQTDVFLHHQN